MRRQKPENAIKRARNWNHAEEGPQTEEEIAETMRNFGLVHPEACPKHKDGKLVPATVFKSHCAEMREGFRRCNTSVGTLTPYVSPQARVFVPSKKWMFWRLVALLVPVRAMQFLLNVSKENLRAQFQELYDACDHYCQKFHKATSGMQRCQIDETFISSRGVRRTRVTKKTKKTKKTAAKMKTKKTPTKKTASESAWRSLLAFIHEFSVLSAVSVSVISSLLFVASV